MLFTNKDLIPRHTGVLFSLLILVLLLVLNFNKCYSGVYNFFNASNKESFQTKQTEPVIPNNPAAATAIKYEIKTVDKLNVEIKPEAKRVKVSFDDVQPANEISRRTGYLIVLAKYDKNLNEVDALNVKVSRETNNTPQPTATGASNISLTSICNTDNICTYTFNNLEAKDAAGDLYYYKLGVGVIYTTNEGEVVSDIIPYKFGAGNQQQYFRLDINQQEQEKLVRRLDEIERQSIFKPKEASSQPLVGSEDASMQNDIDSYMRMLRPFIGNYPDEFTLDKNKIKELTLQDYLGESMALGQLNINVDVADLVKQPPASKI